MKSKYLRPVSLLLAVCMVFSLCVVPASAAEIFQASVSPLPPASFNSNGGYTFIASSHPPDEFYLQINYSPVSDSVIPANSYFQLCYKPMFGRVANMTIPDWVLSNNFQFETFSYSPYFYRIDVLGIHADSSGGADIIYSDSESPTLDSACVCSGLTTRDYSMLVARIYFQDFQFYVSSNGVGDSDLALISVALCSMRYSSAPLPSDETVSYVDSQVAALRAELQAHKEEIADALSDIVDYLVEIKANEALIKSYVSLIFQELEGFGADVDKALAYLNSISQNTATMVTALNTVQSYLSEGNTTLTKILSSCLSMSSDLASALDYMNRLCSDVGALREQGESVQTYLESIDSRFDFLNEKIKSFEEKIGDQSKSLRDILTYLASIDTSLSSASSYLQNISTNVAGLKDDTAAIIQLITTSNATIKNIYSTLGSILSKLGSGQQNFIQLILNNLISQGTKLDRILSLLQTIEAASSTTAANSTLIVSSLETLLSDLEKLEAAHTDTNERLDKIADLIEGFEVNIQKSVDKVYTSSDKKGLGGILASIVSRLSSIINFVGDVFGNMLTSIPDMIGGFNDSLAFWDTAERYEYRPYQIGIYAKDSADYTNSNSAVQALFAEAEKYLGYPYVWGGASPETSFDCSGYVSYVLNASGVYPVSRLTAQGLYNICTPVDASEAMPGDLIFFTKTYQTTDTVTHVGFYAGDGRMLHCGDPIQYIDWENSHYKSHFYAFGRLPYNSTPHFEKDLPEYLFFDLEALENDGFVTLDLSVTFSEPDYLIHWYCSEDAGSTWNQIADYDGLSTVPVSVQYPFADFLKCVNDNPIWIKCVAESNAGQTYDSTAARIIYDGWEGHYAE